MLHGSLGEDQTLWGSQALHLVCLLQPLLCSTSLSSSYTGLFPPSARSLLFPLSEMFSFSFISSTPAFPSGSERITSSGKPPSHPRLSLETINFYGTTDLSKWQFCLHWCDCLMTMAPPLAWAGSRAILPSRCLRLAWSVCPFWAPELRGP